MISNEKLDELIREHERYGIMAHRNNDKDALRLINSVVDALQELKECRAVTDCEKSSYIDEKGIPTELAVLKRQYLEFKNENIQLKKELEERMECELRPATKFVTVTNNSEQIRKIYSEYTEMVTAYEELVAYAKCGMKSTQEFERLHEAFCLEIIDTMAACMTLLHITKKDTNERAELFRKHNAKDKARGYFDEPVADQNKHRELDELSKAAAPLIELMQRKYNPHHKIIVTLGGAEVMSGEMGVPAEVRDIE